MSTFRDRAAALKGSGTASFRLRLRIAMMLVVLGITGTVLYFAQRGMERDAERILQQEFRAAFANLLGVQAAHRAMIAERCGAVAGALRTRSALEDDNHEALYVNADVELRGLMKRSNPGPDASALQATFFRFLDTKGKVLAPTADYTGTLAAPTDEQLAASAGVDEQQVGYATVRGEQKVRIDEIVSTP